MEHIEAFPLLWPQGRPRARNQERSRFNTSLDKASHDLLHELDLLGATSPVISSNLRLRQDGLPLSKQRAPDDTGIAVYFQYNGTPMCFACDKYLQTRDNIQAVMKTIEALRGIERWGTGDMLARAFTGFTALPNNTRPWRELIAYQDHDKLQAEKLFRPIMAKAHPDRGGSDEQFHVATKAREEMRKELG